ncbi:MAG: vitamin K epoxide reductase family protein [Cyanobacteria bacterium P01_D01_bin.105]
MPRKRKQQPQGIQRYSRHLIAGASAAGVLLAIGCIAKGSSSPLSGSAYVQFGAISIPLLGAVTYTAMLILALLPNLTKNKDLAGKTWLGMFVCSTAMTIFSGYLLYVMFSVVGESCVPCAISAGLSFGLWTLTLLDNYHKRVGQLLLPGVSVALIALLATTGLHAYAQNPDSFSAGNPPPVVSTESGPSEIALAKHLTSIGAKKYGAWWCPHCHAQQTLFGQQAFDDIAYVECDPNGVKPKTSTCQAVGVRSYPTWEINGELHSGVQSLQTLAELSGYSGPKEFMHQTSQSH